MPGGSYLSPPQAGSSLMLYVFLKFPARPVHPPEPSGGLCAHPARRKLLGSERQRSHPGWDFQVDVVAHRRLGWTWQCVVREALRGASERPLHFRVVSPVQSISGDAFRVRNLSAALSCPRLDMAAAGRQLWAWASGHRHGVSKNFTSLELSLGRKKSLLVSIAASRPCCWGIPGAKVEIPVVISALVQECKQHRQRSSSARCSLQKNGLAHPILSLSGASPALPTLLFSLLLSHITRQHFSCLVKERCFSLWSF